MTKHVYLHGPLREKYGSEPFEFKADNLNELLAGLSIFCPGFRRELRNYASISLVKVRDGIPTSLTQEDLAFNFGACEQLHLNVNVTAAGAETFALAIASYGTAAYYAAYAIYTIALMYVMGQVIQGMQDTITTEAGKPDNKSALFNGPENRVRQGARVQLNYGRFRVGSVTLNQAMTSVRQVLVKTDAFGIYVQNNGSLNIFTNDLFSVTPTVTNFTINGVTTAAGVTYTVAPLSLTVRVDANGLITATSTDATLYAFDITITGTDTGSSPAQPINQVVTFTVSDPPESYYDSGAAGGGSDGPGGPAGGGPAGDDGGAM